MTLPKIYRSIVEYNRTMNEAEVIIDEGMNCLDHRLREAYFKVAKRVYSHYLATGRFKQKAVRNKLKDLERRIATLHHAEALERSKQ